MLIIGHKGAGHLEPPNTLQAANRAVEMGLRTIEVDVQITGDDRLILMHDRVIREGSQKEHNLINTYSLDEIRNMNFWNDGDRMITGESIDLLSDLLDQYLEKVNIVLDIKGSCMEADARASMLNALEDLLLDRKEDNTAMVSSTDHLLLKQWKQRFPGGLTGMIYRGYWICLDDEIENVQPDWVNPYWRYVTEDLVDRMHRHGVKVCPWTVNSIRDVEQLEAMGVDGIFTDRPERMLERYPQSS